MNEVEASWNVMAHAQKPDFVFWRNGRFHLNRRGPQFSRLLEGEVCASAVVMLDTPCSEVVWRVLATHSIRQFPLHFPSRESPCAIMFQLDSTNNFSPKNWSCYEKDACTSRLDWNFGTMWLRIGTGGRLLPMRLLTSGFRKMRGIFWLPKNQLPSQKWLCTVQ